MTAEIIDLTNEQPAQPAQPAQPDYNLNVQLSKSEVTVMLKALHFIWNHRADIGDLPDTDIAYNMNITHKLVSMAFEATDGDDRDDAKMLRGTAMGIIMRIKQEVGDAVTNQIEVTH